MGFLNKVIPTKYIEIHTLIAEIIMLIGVTLFVFSRYGYSKEYYIFGVICLWIIFWRLWNYGNTEKINTKLYK